MIYKIHAAFKLIWLVLVTGYKYCENGRRFVFFGNALFIKPNLSYLI